MPIKPENRSRYPSNWEEIAIAVKNRAGWQCQHCGRPCRPPGIALRDTLNWVKTHHPTWATHGARPHQFTLTVAHLDHDPANCRDGNLRALCAPCHLRYDLSHHQANAARTRAAKTRDGGQLALF